MGFEGRTPVASVSFVHMLTTVPQFCIASSNIVTCRSELRFAHLPHASIPTLKTHLRIEALQGGNEVYGNLVPWKYLYHLPSRLGTSLFGLMDNLRWSSGSGVGLAPVHSFSFRPASHIKVQFIGISAQGQ